MNVLITGGAGFIGSHLTERCLREGWRVTVIDDLSTGSIENIQPFQSNPHYACVVDSIFNPARVRELVEEADLVFHLAAAVGVRLIVESAIQVVETNVHGTEVVLAAAARSRTPVILASTSEVYGKATTIPFREDADLVIGPPNVTRWSYACSKALDEFLGLAYWVEHRVPVTVVRFFNTVGPRQSGRYGMVLPNFVNQALAGEPITVYGDGEQRRSFGYVGDVVESLVRLCQCANVAGEVVNIGNDSEITINRLALLVKDACGSDSEIVHVPYDIAYGPGFEDMYRRVPCLEKLQSLIGYRPETPIEAIVERVIAERHRVRSAAVA